MPATPQPPRFRRVVTALTLGPVNAAGWRAAAHLLAGLPLSTAGFAAVILFGVLTIGLAPTVLPALGTLSILVGLSHAFSQVHRLRFRALLGVRFTLAVSAPTPAGAGWLSRRLDQTLNATSARQLCYHLLAFVVNVVGAVAVIVLWPLGIGLSLILFYGWALPEPLFIDEQIVLTLGGMGCIFLAPWSAICLASMDSFLARQLLTAPRTQVLEQRVEVLTESRNGAVRAADAERLRIERDLHDGTQQRLTALAMNLGIARQVIGDESGPAAEAIAAAHEDAKVTLAELRHLVRGLHPPVLADRGLDAALSGLVQRSVVPVRLDVLVEPRPSMTVESVAYFVVSEALTNMSRHAEASCATVTARRIGDLLHVSIQDDGRGGAAERPDGTGLRGLRQRVASIEGRLEIQSPPSCGTTITVELPCVS